MILTERELTLIIEELNTHTLTLLNLFSKFKTSR